MRLVVFFLIVVHASTSSAEDWRSFRGPNGNGISNESSLSVTEWGPNKNILWKAELPMEGNGSPIIVKGKVFVCCAEDENGLKRSLYCFDRNNGKRLWVRTVEYGKKMPTHKTNPYCGSTPVSDGERVVAWHSSAGLYCYDLNGKQLWKKDLGEFSHIWGYGSSPVLVDGRIILNCGPGKRNFVAAIDLKSGDKVWEVEEPYKGDGNRNELNNYMGSWATPVVAKVKGRTQIIVSQSKRIVSYAPDNGEILWSCAGLRGERGDLAYSSPVLVDNLCVAIGGYQGPSIGVDLSTDAKDKKFLWRVEKNPQSIGTGVAIDGYIYRPNAGRPSPIECLSPKTGKVVWSSPAGGGICWGSVVAVGKTLMVTNQAGTTTLFEADPKEFKLISKNDLGEGCNGTPAISNGQIFIRTFKNLVCIGK